MLKKSWSSIFWNVRTKEKEYSKVNANVENPTISLRSLKYKEHNILLIGGNNIKTGDVVDENKYAFLESASSIIVIHNHPSNNTMPSKEDIELTNKLFEIGNIMAIPVIDHIIIGIDNYYSFYENMHKN